MNIFSTNPSILFSILTAWAAAFIIALWVGLIFWVVRDSKRRGHETIIHFFSFILVTLLFLPGVIVYILIRNPKTIEEEYQQALEEEMILATVNQVEKCPGCDRLVEKEWQICPTCHTQLKRKCDVCDAILEMNWTVCPYCLSSITANQATSPPKTASSNKDFSNGFLDLDDF
jgi:RNA polymerase subunit RPABC4/transcription elongation factor Spt4